MQHKYEIPNQAGAGFRADLNAVLAAIASNNSGPEEPQPAFAFQWWADTLTGRLKQRNAANNAWISVFDRANHIGPLNWAWAVYGGTANAITLAPAFARTAYAAGDEFRFRATATNTGATTINVGGLGAKAAVTATGVALPAGYIRTDVDTVCVYDGTKFVVQREIEIGSNANGRFVKEASGRLTCSNVFGSNSTTPTTYGQMFISGTVPMTFPHVFAGAASDVIVKRSDRYVSGASIAWGITQTVTTSSVVSFAVSANNTGECRLGYEATGSWY